MIVALAVLITLTVSAQSDPKAKGLESITDDLVIAQLNFLASDWTEGREAVSKGAFLAADYIASVFQMTGLAPVGDMQPNGKRSYFQRVPMIRTTPGDIQSLSVITNAAGGMRLANNYIQGTDYSVQNAGDVSRNILAPLVFIGYGMIDEANGYDELKGVDVNGKVVVRLSGYPGHRDVSSTTYEKFKPQPPAVRTTRVVVDPRVATANRTLAEKGALAIITITPDRVAFSTQLAVNSTFYPNQRITPTSAGRVALLSSTPDDSPLSVTVSPRLGIDMLGSSTFIEEFEKNAAKTMKPQSSLVQGKNIDIVSTVKSELVMGVNVLAMIEGKNKAQNIVVGGHYDHLGTNGAQIWNGADDDASGTVAAMSLGRAFIASGEQPACNIIFAAWTAEEKGLLGSRYFVETFPDIDQIVMNMNFDMIARDDAEDTNKNLVEYTYTDTYPQWLEICKANIKNYNLPIGLREDPQPIGFTIGTDFSPFSTAGRPFISWFTGYHPDYHQYTDKLSLVNWQKCINIIRLGYLITWDIAQQITVEK